MFNSFFAGQNNFRCFQQILYAEIGLLFQRFRVTAINENRATPGGVTAVNVPPTIAHHPALREVNAQFARSAQQHARLGFAAVAIGLAFARMITNFNAIHWQLPTHFRMDRLDNFFFERPAAHVRLVCYDNEQKARLFQTATRLRHFGKNLKFAQTCRRIR